VRVSTTLLEPSPTTTVKSPPSTDAPRLAAEQIAEIDDPEVRDAVEQIVAAPEEITVEEARSIFEAIDVLEPETLAVVVEALSEAAPEVKEEFEEAVNIYDGAFDAYVPSGSNVTVAQRRTIVVVTAATASPLSPLAPASVRRRR